MLRHTKNKILPFKIIFLILIIFIAISYLSITKKTIKTQIHQLFLTMNQALSIPLIYAKYNNIYSYIHNLKNFKIDKNFEIINKIIDKKNYNALTNEVEELKNNLIRRVILVKGSNPKKFKAKIKYKNHSIPATVELKGQFLSHIQYDNSWSLEIKLKKGHTIKGYENFSIQNFNQRQFPYNAILAEIYDQEKFTTKNYSPLKVFVNGITWGVMYAEEEFSETFFERRKIKNPFVFSIGDKHKYGNTYKKLKSNNINYKDSEILDYINLDLNNFFQINVSGKNIKKNILIDQISKNEIKKNVYQITNMRSKILSNYQFDLLKNDLIKLYSLSIIFCENHALADFNLNYYLSHYNHKIEIMPGDFSYNNYVNYKPFNKKLFSNAKNAQCNLENLIKNYDYKFLNLIDKKENRDKIISYIGENYERLIDLYNKKLTILSKNYNLVDNFFQIKKIDDFEKKVLKNINNVYQLNNNINNKTSIKKLNLNKLEKYIKKDIDIFFDKENLFIVNLTKYPVIINSLQIENKKEYILNEYVGPSNLEKLTIYKLDDLKNDINKNLKINYTYLNKKLHKIVDSFPIFYSSNLKSLLKLDTKKNNFTFTDKKVVLNEPLIIPNGYDLNIDPGTQIKFSENSYILLMGGKVEFNGLKKEPIIFTNLKENLFWKGIYVIQSDNDVSTLTNVNFQNLDFHKSKFNLTGGINFYKGEVNLENINTFNCISEDCINFIESKVYLENISISKSISDAIDFDFSEGKINNLNLNDIGGDALDFSGSDFLIENTNIANVIDKGISNGEASKLRLKSIKINNSKIGIANKDGSFLLGEDLNLVNNHLDIAAYQKKSFYNQSILKISKFKGNSENYIEKGHHVEINGKILKHVTKNNEFIAK